MIELPFEVLAQIFGRLHSPLALTRCSEVNRSWQIASKDSRLWSDWCQKYWVPADPAMFTPTPSPATPTTQQTWKDRERDRFSRQPVSKEQARQVFALWCYEFRNFHPLYVRLKGLAQRLLLWLRQHSPTTLVSLQPGTLQWRQELWSKLISPRLFILQRQSTADGQRSHEQIEIQMNQQQQESLQAFALLFHFIDGQKPRMPHVDAGLFGTYTCYTHFTSVFMLPMKYLRTQHLEEFHQSVLIIFALCPRTGFYYGLVIESRWTDLVGQVVHVNMVSRNFIRYGLFLPWLEQYVSDLVDRQQYDIIGEDRVLSMFKNHAPPYTSRALSRGVLCEVSTHCMLETISPSLPWVYRVKFQLSTDGIESPRVCQLIRRRWAVRYQSGLVKHVADELVVGQMPVLRVDSPLFTYCSICGGHAHGEEDPNQEDFPVQMEGEFEFICGTIESFDPRENFTVRVAPFSFPIPEKFT